MVLLVGDCEQQKQNREIYVHLVLIREAFQTKKRGNFGPGQKSKKIPIISWEKLKKVRKSKKSQVPEGIKD